VRYSRKIGPPIVSAAVATLVLTNFATVSIIKDNTNSQLELFGSIWPIALTSAVAVILVMSFLYKSLVDLVDELEAREANAQHQALHDQLTGLANRALLEDRLSQALTRYRRSGEQVALLMLDLDRFKQVNDTLGHNAGDKLVQEVGERLRSLLRETDTVARIGGDEFAIVQVSPKGEADVRRLCERIISVIRKPFLIGDAKRGSASRSARSSRPRKFPRRPSCCARRTSPCTAPRPRAATASACSPRRWTPTSSAATRSNRPCGPS